MQVDEVVRWAQGRGLEAFAQADGSGVLVVHDGDEGAWTAQVAQVDGWFVVRAMPSLQVPDERLPGAPSFAARANSLSQVGVVVVEPADGDVWTRAAAPDADGGLDAAWDASVEVTGRWVPGLRDVASGIDPDAAFARTVSTGLQP